LLLIFKVRGSYLVVGRGGREVHTQAERANCAVVEYLLIDRYSLADFVNRDADFAPRMRASFNRT
jgi:hypothetical protein